MKCYHVISRDTSCRASELLKLRIKGILFKSAGGRQYAQIHVNGKPDRIIEMLQMTIITTSSDNGKTMKSGSKMYI